MTSVSTVIGMGMMPLCLLVYSRSWVETGSIRIPYSNIGEEFRWCHISD